MQNNVKKTDDKWFLAAFSSFGLSHVPHVRSCRPRSSGLARQPFIIGLMSLVFI